MAIEAIKSTNNKQPRGLGWRVNSLLWLAFILIILAWLLTPYFVQSGMGNYVSNIISEITNQKQVPISDLEGAAQFGDQYGAANALFAALSTLFLIVTLLMQRQELEYQREEIIQTRGEMELQRQAMQRQVNESTMFQLMRMYRDNMTWLETSSWRYGDPRLHGKQALDEYSRRLDRYIKKETGDEVDETSRKKYYKDFLRKDDELERWKSVVDVYLSMVSFIGRPEITTADHLLYKELISANASKLEIEMLRLHILYTDEYHPERKGDVIALNMLCDIQHATAVTAAPEQGTGTGN